MSLRKHGLKALGLSFLAALSLMAIGAAGAQANGAFLVGGANIPAGLVVNATGEVDLLGVLLVPDLNIEIDCKKFKVKSGTLLTGGVGHAELLYEECEEYGTKPSLVLLTECEIYESKMDEELHLNQGNILAKGLLLVVLHKEADGKEIALVEATGAPFALIFLPGCNGVEHATVNGSVLFERHLGGDQVKHLVREVAASLRLSALLAFGTHDAFLDGAVWVSLTGAEHLNKAWGII
jgi:hypothetical protein